MRLFRVLDLKAGAPLAPTYSDKQAAKTHRDELNGEAGLRFVIDLGPDHRHYRGDVHVG